MTEPLTDDQTPSEFLSETELLKKWLSVAESQICALEVLSEQMPKVNALLEKDMTNVSEYFSQITNSIKAQKTSAEALQEKIGEDPEAQKLVANIMERHQEVTEIVGKIIVAMQFQDRVSQNIVININVMKAIIVYLQNIIDTTLDNFEHEYQVTGERRRTKLDPTFAQKIIENLWLGELRNDFVNHLLNHGYIKDPEEIGHDMTNASDEDVDLF